MGGSCLPLLIREEREEHGIEERPAITTYGVLVASDFRPGIAPAAYQSGDSAALTSQPAACKPLRWRRDFACGCQSLRQGSRRVYTDCPSLCGSVPHNSGAKNMPGAARFGAFFSLAPLLCSGAKICLQRALASAKPFQALRLVLAVGQRQRRWRYPPALVGQFRLSHSNEKA